jgi:hypothetical protein
MRSVSVLKKRGQEACITVVLNIRQHAKPPRAVFVPFMMGHHSGVPFHQELQRRIIIEPLGRLSQVEQSGNMYRIPITWAPARREGIELVCSMGLKR